MVAGPSRRSFPTDVLFARSYILFARSYILLALPKYGLASNSVFVVFTWSSKQFAIRECQRRWVQRIRQLVGRNDGAVLESVASQPASVRRPFSLKIPTLFVIWFILFFRMRILSPFLSLSLFVTLFSLSLSLSLYLSIYLSRLFFLCQSVCCLCVSYPLPGFLRRSESVELLVCV